MSIQTVLTPRGLRHPDDLDVGDEVLSRNVLTGALVCNRLETRPQWIDRSEFSRWWNYRSPAFRFLRINKHFVFSRSQSIWVNGFITHVAKIRVGDVIYTERNRFVRVHSVEDVRRTGWWRFDVDGDHSYILDGALVHNASRFWVSGTGTWDSSTTTHWGSASGTADNSSVPGSADAVVFDGSSGGGTATLNFGGTITIQSITLGAYTGTFDNSVNNNNMTMSANTGFSCSGTATKTIKAGTATYTVSATANSSNPVNMQSATNLTYTGGSETWVYSGVTQGARGFIGGKSYGNLTINANCGLVQITQSSAADPSFHTITLNAGTGIVNATSSQITATGLTGGGSSSSGKQASILNNVNGTQGTISVASGTQTLTGCAIKDTIFTGGATFAATGSFDLGNNSGITITPPSSGGGLSPAPIVVGRGTPY